MQPRQQLFIVGSLFNPIFKFDEALEMLKRGGVNVTERAYGFSVSETDSNGIMTAECGIEHSGRVSMSAWYGKPPVTWFFRDTASEIASILIAAQKLVADNPQIGWMEALRAADPKSITVGNDGRKLDLSP